MIWVFICSVFIASVSQILLKKGSQQKNIYINKFTFIGYALLVVSTLLTAFAYKKLELSTGMVLESLSYFFVPILSLIFLREKITTRKKIGALVIVLGIILVYL